MKKLFYLVIGLLVLAPTYFFNAKSVADKQLSKLEKELPKDDGLPYFKNQFI